MATTLPSTEELRATIRVRGEELRALRRLMRLAEAAERAEQARQRRLATQAVQQQGGAAHA
jgi:hypothetical protein